MTQASVSELNERVPGRRWTVRLDAAGRGSAEVRVSCSRPACADLRLPSAADGRRAAVAHLKAHLRAAVSPRPTAQCACRADGCHAHVPDTDRSARTEPWRCGGPVVLTVIADRAGRWWRALECCSRCAAAIPGARTTAAAPASGPPDAGGPPLTTANAATGAGAGAGADGRPGGGPGAGTPRFSDRSAQSGAQVPPARPTPTRHRPRPATIAQRVVPDDLRPVELRDELVALGDLFRAYQRRDQPDLALLADLHTRKAHAFAAWAEACGDRRLRLDARRAEQAADAARAQHEHRTGLSAAGDRPPVARLLTGAAQWDHARSVLAHVVATAPLPGPQVRLLVTMLTLRTAHSGTGHLVGQDLTGMGLSEPEDLIARLTDCGWLHIPGTPAELLASRPENPVSLTVPSLTPRTDAPAPFAFGKKVRPKLSGWAQRVVSDKKLRKAGAAPGTRFLALTLATRCTADGRLGTGGDGIDLDRLAVTCAVDLVELRCLVDQLTAADWVEGPAVTDGRLTGRLTERVLPLTCPLPQPGLVDGSR
ncbi:hypothetical protein [Streptomyces asoensis]|uniref:Uncharacterized protein n=1 Tax=Streptomyces asoensis TaxID=249586 RepID=A0ABQ3RXR6_9ACTN|nr:hypothetical protein [Streptomyces asoensis]GGQ53873.1 hypothetical protein GCM10010496_15740 [Streptomyces asoensis]GHI60665.1 hypothetical protein Saso_23150 [Streptomyces asoensis]